MKILRGHLRSAGEPTSGADRGPTVNQIAAGGAYVILSTGALWLSSSPLAHADDVTLPAPADGTPAAGPTGISQDWLYGDSWGGLYLGHASVYAALSDFGSDSLTQVANVYSTEMTFFSDIISDVGTVGNLIEGGIGDIGSLMSGIGAVNPAPGTAVTVSNLITALNESSDYFTGTNGIITDLKNGIGDGGQIFDPTRLDENYSSQDAWDFQNAVNYVIANLPAANNADNNNLGLIYDLEQILAAEDAEKQYITNLIFDMENPHGPAQIVSDNAYIYDLNTVIYNDLNSAVQGMAWDHLFG